MKRQSDLFIFIGLGIALFLAVFLSPFASPLPDGLERVAQTKEFSQKGEPWKLWKSAPFSNYGIPWIKNEWISTPLSGLIGTGTIFLLFLGFGKLIRRFRKPNQL